MDISADLTELARTPVAVVCAGAKAILDLPRTLEVLETFGVPVVGYATKEFPAFYSRESGLQLVHRVETPDEAAKVMRAQWGWGKRGTSEGTKTGILFANPAPGKVRFHTAKSKHSSPRRCELPRRPEYAERTSRRSCCKKWQD